MGLLGVEGDRSWFLADAPDGSLRLIEVGNATSEITGESVFAVGTHIAMAAGSLWILDPADVRLWRLDLEPRSDG